VNDAKEDSLLFNTGTNSNFSLSNVPADKYPYLRLVLNVQDSISLTIPKLNHWRVYHTPYPEVSLNQNEYFKFNSDTLQEGNLIEFGMALTNAGMVSMDSITVRFSVIDQSNSETIVGEPVINSLGPNETTNIDYSFSTKGMQGDNILVVEVNPDGIQPEKFEFNNLLLLPFHVIFDDLNPLLDVTFDGKHILNGDIVSAKPEITVQLKDENTFLALNDTNDLQVRFKYPNGLIYPAYFGAEDVEFIPPTDASDNNQAELIIRREFEEDGIYEMTVFAKDRSGNRSGANDYNISFEVINEAQVSNVLNYPNPFTSSTKFIFTLTGSEVPEEFKIQIMAVSGKVIREITKEELGPITVGRNITEYAWDGTDEYGNELGNGVYFYRVITKQLDGSDLEQFRVKQVDPLFKKGIGKMYLMR